MGSGQDFLSDKSRIKAEAAFKKREQEIDDEVDRIAYRYIRPFLRWLKEKEQL